MPRSWVRSSGIWGPFGVESALMAYDTRVDQLGREAQAAAFVEEVLTSHSAFEILKQSLDPAVSANHASL